MKASKVVSFYAVKATFNEVAFLLPVESLAINPSLQAGETAP
jgi:hypothetical protein